MAISYNTKVIILTTTAATNKTTTNKLSTLTYLNLYHITLYTTYTLEMSSSNVEAALRRYYTSYDGTPKQFEEVEALFDSVYHENFTLFLIAW